MRRTRLNLTEVYQNMVSEQESSRVTESRYDRALFARHLFAPCSVIAVKPGARPRLIGRRQALARVRST